MHNQILFCSAKQKVQNIVILTGTIQISNKTPSEDLQEKMTLRKNPTRQIIRIYCFLSWKKINPSSIWSLVFDKCFMNSYFCSIIIIRYEETEPSVYLLESNGDNAGYVGPDVLSLPIYEAGLVHKAPTHGTYLDG